MVIIPSESYRDMLLNGHRAAQPVGVAGGTPVSSEDRDIRAIFGDYIHAYDMQQAKEDSATVAIYYESRLAKLSLKILS